MKAKQVFEKIQQEKGSHEFIPTGFKGMDEKLDGGFLKKELVVLGGPTGTGKSYLAIHFAMQAANAGFKTGYFSLEISNELVVARMIGMMSNIKAAHVLYGLHDEGDIEYKKAQAHIFGYSDLFETFDDTYDLAEIDRIAREQKFDMIVVDFIQNVFASKSDEYERLSLVALSLQRLAKALNVSIIILSQLSNLVSKAKDDDRPLEFKGSGSIATVADLGFFLTKGDNSLALPGTENYNLLLSKNRRGASKQLIPLLVRWPGGAFYEQTQ